MGKLETFICIFISLNLKSTSSERNDVTFIIDASTSSSTDQYDSTIDFVYNVTDMLPFGIDKNMFAVVTFNDTAMLHFRGNETVEKINLLKNISNLKSVFPAGIRNTHAALYLVAEEIYHDAKVNLRTVVLIVRGGGTSPGDSLFASFTLNPIIDKLYVVGVGSFVTDSSLTEELYTIASDRDYVLLVQTFSGLCGLVPTLALALDSNASIANHSCSTEEDTTLSDGITTTSTAFFTSTEKEETLVTVPFSTKNSGSGASDDSTVSESSTTINTLVDTTATDSTSMVYETRTTFAEQTSSTIHDNWTDSTTSNNFNSTTESPLQVNNEGSILIVLAASIIVVLVIILSVMVLGLVWYFKIYRKQKKLKELIEILANEYPDARSGLGPRKSRYTEARPQVFKNGHSNKFHSYLKLTMMTNGHKPVFR